MKALSLIIPSGNEYIPSTIAARYIFTIDFSDGTKRELYKNFVLSGEKTRSDSKLLASALWTDKSSPQILTDFKEQLLMLTRNYEAALRSEYEGVLNVRAKCVGLMQSCFNTHDKPLET